MSHISSKLSTVSAYLGVTVGADFFCDTGMRSISQFSEYNGRNTFQQYKRRLL